MKFNSVYYRKIKDENEKHKKAKHRLRHILLSINPHITITEEAGFSIATELGRRDYIADMYIENNSIKQQDFIVEIDGPSHGHKKRTVKDEIRDTAFRNIGIATVRFSTDDIVSKNAMSDTEIITHIENSLEQQKQNARRAQF